MRLWSIHPKYLDVKGLTALWRETLLAQKVLKGETKGYTQHPQLVRFKTHPEPANAIAFYLDIVWHEASLRGYNYDKNKIEAEPTNIKIPVNSGQILYEYDLLCKKLTSRCSKIEHLTSFEQIAVHPLFEVVRGPLESWEKPKTASE